MATDQIRHTSGKKIALRQNSFQISNGPSKYGLLIQGLGEEDDVGFTCGGRGEIKVHVTDMGRGGTASASSEIWTFRATITARRGHWIGDATCMDGRPRECIIYIDGVYDCVRRTGMFSVIKIEAELLLPHRHDHAA